MVLKTGVPQGSIIGPILFLVYINDIEHSSKLLSFILFADDTNIFYSNSCLKSLNTIIQVEINKVAEWLNVDKLSVNIKKTKAKKVQTFLGIIIDECLTWKDHIA
jgi:hypothetical protein